MNIQEPIPAVVYCRDSFNTPNGKTAHGLVRFTRRYQVMAVVDPVWSGRDAGEVLDGSASGIPVVDSVEAAVAISDKNGISATHLVVGLAPDGGRLGLRYREDIARAIGMGLHVHSGLHDFLSEDQELFELAQRHAVVLTDVRKPPPVSGLHFFAGDIERVDSLKVAVLGTDSAVGKRTTAWLLVRELESRGVSVEMIGTGQTAWMQGARYGIIMDSLVNDFVSGEIEHAVCLAWKEQHPRVIVVEGQGSLMNPAYPGGFEILAAARPDVVVMQHAPARIDYDGFPGYPIHPLPRQIQAVDVISGRPVVAITVNHENLSITETTATCRAIRSQTGLPAMDVLRDGAGELADIILAHAK
ncbi:MAG: DUF1611 domain-containing protein [Candidatus Aminicenantes bacterium]|nr:DUF1611 domain-containing protein [Candidatus Aminicenantes bacterium]